MDKTEKKINWSNILTIVISIIALILSFLSYQISKQNLDYEIDKDSFLNTPAITEIVDSTIVRFKLNNENSELQSLLITFPNDVNIKSIKTAKKPVEISTTILENSVKSYVDNKIMVKDSFAIVGHVGIPVVFDYSAIVFGSAQNLRENRILIFDVHYYESVKKINFSNSFLITRLGYPIKKHYFYTGPFSKPLEEKLAIQDSIDLQELLRTQLKNIK
ncbi:hypothetical protein JSO54_10270 [Riemerella anatipestifer]|uniref:hypothetical protein n=1 Tax=Riemerella anatipestifer TaxID=34085 RepID=UPI001374EB22|nr:hypothetical protein [Riemerella anatipestifer]